MMTAVEWSKRGFADLIPVVPPGAEIAPGSKLSPASAGKSPGIRRQGKWSGCPDWTTREWSPAGIDRMQGSLGLRTRYTPCLDLDIPEAAMVEMVHATAADYLGHPLDAYRVGAAPKRAYLFVLSGDKFGRMRLEFMYRGKRCLIEILADGQQVVIDGMHRSGKPYTWSRVPSVDELPTLTREQAEGLLQAIADELAGLGIQASFGSAGATEHGEVNQESLRGPIEKVRAAVSACPNTVDTYPSRDIYIQMAYAIRAATDESEEGYEIFEEWALEWPDATEEKVREHWDSLRGPYRIGAEWIYSQARRFGWGDAAEEFEVVETKRGETKQIDFVEYSDMWMVQQFLQAYGALIRYDQDSKRWYRFRDGIWRADAAGVTQLAIESCAEIADAVARAGATDKEQAAALAKAKSLSSRKMLQDMLHIAASMESIKVEAKDFDPDPDIIGIPGGGAVNLRTGERMVATPEMMLSNCTAVAPTNTPTPVWDAFLLQATGGNPEFVSYLERAAGYTLTGHTSEHKFFYIYGNGGTGKSTFLDVLYSIMGGYAHAADSGMFLDHRDRQHTQELAALRGRRVVTLNEVKKGRAWNEARLKGLTAGDVINARQMYGSDFNFRLSGKFWMAANNCPVFSGIDGGIARRVQVIPFVHRPETVDKGLMKKLAAEYGGILYRLILAAGDWYRDGLVEASEVTGETEEFLEHEDLITQWREECCEPTEFRNEWSRSSDLFDSWVAWNRRNGREHQITAQSFAAALRDKQIKRYRVTGVSYWEGLKLAGGRTEFEVVQ